MARLEVFITIVVTMNTVTAWTLPSNSSCSPDNFTCFNDECVPFNRRCDRIEDCSDGSDEEACFDQPCLETQFTCNSSGKCVPLNWRCDRVVDCGDDASDEEGCPPLQCLENEFSCGNEMCLPQRYRCDGSVDCYVDGSDEEACPPMQCTDHEFMCNVTGRCMPLNWRCDGQQDCADGLDEQDCPADSHDNTIKAHMTVGDYVIQAKIHLNIFLKLFGRNVTVSVHPKNG